MNRDDKRDDGRDDGRGVNRRALIGGAGVAAAATAAAVSPALAQTPPRGGSGGEAPVAETAHGRVRGQNRGPVKAFFGVPYGAPTGAANRWLPPKPPANWTGVRDCIHYGAAPPQNEPIGAPMREETAMLQQAPIDEDCLHLNVWTPAVGPNSGKRAVMVWFHGGGFSAGSGNADSYDGVNLCSKHDVVLVTVTHRLNHFGFLYLGELFGDAYAQSGNVGMLDAVAALRWVHDNIVNFGGDPSRVMVFGQSGGGAKVSTLMGMPSAKGLFHRVAAQSGAARAVTRDQAAASAKRLVDALGAKSIAELQAMPWEHIEQIARQNRGAGGSGPMIDMNLPAQVFDPAASPLSRDVPLISCTTETEAASWGATTYPVDNAQMHDQVKEATRLSDADTDALIAIYRQAYPGKDNMYLTQLLQTQWGFNYGVLTQAEKKAAQTAEAGAAPMFFAYFTKHTTVRDGRLHAPHTSEIPYCFDSLMRSRPIIGDVTPDKQALADKVSGYWTNFAKTGDPNGAGLTRWEPFNLTTRATMVLNDQPAMVNDPWGTTRRAVAEYKAKAAPQQARG